MIHVAYCSSSTHGGGALNYLVDLIEHHDPALVRSVVYADHHATSIDAAVARLAAVGVPVHRGPLLAPLDVLRRREHWAQVLREHGPFDIASLHQHVPGAAAAFLEGARRAAVPHLIRTEQLPRFPPFDRLNIGLGGLMRAYSQRRLARITDRRIVVAEAGRRALVARGEPIDTIDVVPTAFVEGHFHDLPPREETRAALGIPADSVAVLFLAGLSLQKRPDLYLDMAERLVSEGPGATFLIGGGGPDEDDVRARAARLGDRISFIGPRRDAPAVIAAVDVFVLPSLWEGLPLTVLEAMRAGAVVVASAVDGTAEVIEDGVTGRLVPPGDLDALCDAVRDVVQSPEARARMQSAARKHVTGRYDAASLARRTEEIYRRALAT